MDISQRGRHTQWFCIQKMADYTLWEQTLEMTCAMVLVLAETKRVTKAITKYPATVLPTLSSNTPSRSTAWISVAAVTKAPPITIVPRRSRGLRPHLNVVRMPVYSYGLVNNLNKSWMYLADDEKPKYLSTEIDHHQHHWPNVAVHSNFTKDWHWIDSTLW